MLNKYFSKENIKIDIINLAQAGTTIYLIVVETLNIYGKYLKADMIMAYFGVNDISQITNTRMFYKNISYGVLPAKRFANYDGPPVMENFKKLFPTVTMVYDLENKIADYFGAPRDYSKSLGIFNRQFIPNAKNINPSIWYKKYLVPEIIKELKE